MKPSYLDEIKKETNFDYEEIIKELLSKEKVRKIIEREKVTKEEFENNLFLFLSLSQSNDEYEVNIKRDEYNNLIRVHIPTKKTKDREKKKNIWLTKISSLPSEPSLKDYFEKNFKLKNYNNFNFDFWNDFFKKANVNIKNKKGVFLYGKPGIGKTHAIQAILNSLYKNGTVAFINVSELQSFLLLQMKSQTSFEDVIEKIKMVDYLALDDIGAESINSWFRDTILLPILSSRMNEKKTTFFTSNYSIKKLLEVESKITKTNQIDGEKAERLIERIKGLSEAVHISGANIREIKNF